MANLRQSLRQCCLVAFVGDINAGKTSLVRSLLGLPLVAGGHLPENATQWVDAYPLPVPTPFGSRVMPESPLLVDTPGMFDQSTTLAEYSVRYLGRSGSTPACGDFSYDIVPLRSLHEVC